MTDDEEQEQGPPLRRVPAIIMTATRLLQARIGRGKIGRDRIEDGEFIIKQARFSAESDVFIAEHMEEIKKLIPALKKNREDLELAEEIAKSIMRFKGNISMFSADKCADLAAVMLRWIESVEMIDQDVIDVLDGYHVTLSQVQSSALDDKVVAVIVDEMKAACDRYFSKHPESKLQAEITNQNAFYVSEDRLDKAEGGDIDDALSNEDYDKGMSDEKLIE